MADFSTSSRKPKTTRKADRSSRLADRSSQYNLSVIEHSEDRLSTDPYQCTGKFPDDFQILCRQSQITSIPLVLNRPKRAPTPTPTETTSKEKLKTLTAASTTRRTTQASNLDSISITQSELLIPGIASSQKQHSIATLNEHSEDSNKEIDGEPLPKTFILVKDRFEYFKPKIHVEYEHPEKSDNVIELFIKGWKIEIPMMTVFQQCFPRLEKLVSLNLCYCGLNEETSDILASFLPKCPSLRNLSLDGNHLSEENYQKFISGESLIQSLSLRNCQVTDLGAAKIARNLGNIYSQNKKLLVLNLSMNFITDIGAIELANSLRTNRTLLVLNLSSNDIGDLGAKKFSEACSRFKMTQEEIVRRRTLKKDQILRDNPTILRKTKSDQNERPISMLQSKTLKEGSLGKTGKKELSNRDRSKSKDHSGKELTIGEKQSGPNKKQKEKDSNSSILAASTQKKEKPGREASKLETSVSNEKTVKTLKSKNSKTKLKDSDNENENLRSTSGGKLGATNQIPFGDADPLMDEVATIEGDLWLSGNRTLISLNLSRNKITQEGLKDFILCVQYQISIQIFHKSAFTNGLLRLNLNKNDFSPTDENFIKLMELMKTRDPIANKSNEILVGPADKDTISVISKDGKDTSRSKSGKSMFKTIA